MTIQWQCRACEKLQPPADKCIRCGSRPLRTLAEVEREAIMRALEHFRDVNLAAEFLGCGRATIYEKLRAYAIQSPNSGQKSRKKQHIPAPQATPAR